MAVFRNIARIIGAGPLIVIDTDVVGLQQVEAGVELLHVVERRDRHAGVADLAVDVGRGSGSSPYSVTESNAVDSRLAGMPSDSN